MLDSQAGISMSAIAKRRSARYECPRLISTSTRPGLWTLHVYKEDTESSTDREETWTRIGTETDHNSRCSALFQVLFERGKTRSTRSTGPGNPTRHAGQVIRTIGNMWKHFAFGTIDGKVLVTVKPPPVCCLLCFNGLFSAKRIWGHRIVLLTAWRRVVRTDWTAEDWGEEITWFQPRS